MLHVNHRIEIPREEFTFTFARSGGPGGQNVNKVESKATLRWDVNRSPTLPADVRTRFAQKFGNRITKEGELVLTSQRTRDQAKNIDDCLEKLREMLLSVAVPPRTRHKTKPTRGSKQRRLTEKKSQASKKAGRRGEW